MPFLFDNFQGNDSTFSPDLNAWNDINLDIESSPIRSCKEDATMRFDELIEEDPLIIPLASLQILRNYTRGIKGQCEVTFEPNPKSRMRLSTKDILCLAGKKFIQTSSLKSSLSKRFCEDLPLVGLSLSEYKDTDIVQKLLSAAEKAGQKKHNQARKFLDECDRSSSENGNQIERLVFYFSKALREKVDRETGRVCSRDSLKKQSMSIHENEMKGSPLLLAVHQAMPISQTGIYAGIQAIVERVSSARRVHVIDLGIMSGIHHSVLMQALADRVECPIELFKITAVTTKLKRIIEVTGERLMSFSESINLPFVFNIVSVPDIRDLNKGLFEFNAGEIVVAIAFYALRTMLGRQGELESLMRVIIKINPCIMVVTEIEGKHNSPVFVNRFIEALFYFGAFFDYVEECMGCDNELRKQTESIHIYYGIRNMIVAEGDERTYRHVSLDIWRRFFSRFDMKEEEMSSTSFIHASLVMKKYACWNSCTVHKDEKSLIFGWKGTPLQHVSAWSFGRSNTSSDDD